MSDNFCPYPFHHLSVGQTSELRACCVAKPFDKNISDVTSLHDWWKTSSQYQKLRESHLNNLKHELCNTCWHIESQGNFSMRKQVAMQTASDFNTDKLEITNIEITGGRLCNLACKMCSSASSSQILKESRPWDLKTDYKTINWLDDPIEQEKLLEVLCLPSLHSIYFTGGEPQLMPCYQEVLTKLAQRKNLSKMSVHFNTNATVFNQQFWQMIKQFYTRQIDLSIDAVGEAYENIRYGADWGRVKDNALKIIDFLAEPNKRNLVYLTVVLQLSNVDQAIALQELYDTLNCNNLVKVDLNILPVCNFDEWSLIHIPNFILFVEWEKLQDKKGIVIEKFRTQLKTAMQNNKFNTNHAIAVLEKEEYFKSQFGRCLWDHRPDWLKTYQALA